MEASNFAHATHEDSFIINCKVWNLVQPWRPKWSHCARFRTVQAAEYRNSIRSRPQAGRESGSPASVLPIVFCLFGRLTGRSLPCYPAQPLHDQVHRKRLILNALRLKSACPAPHSPLAGITGRIPILAKLQAPPGARADRIDFLSRRRVTQTASRIAPPCRAPPRSRAGDCIWRCARCGSPSRS